MKVSSKCCHASIVRYDTTTPVCGLCQKDCIRIETISDQIYNLYSLNTPVRDSVGGRDLYDLNRIDGYYSGYGFYDYNRYIIDHMGGAS